MSAIRRARWVSAVCARLRALWRAALSLPRLRARLAPLGGRLARQDEAVGGRELAPVGDSALRRRAHLARELIEPRALATNLLRRHPRAVAQPLGAAADRDRPARGHLRGGGLEPRVRRRPRRAARLARPRGWASSRRPRRRRRSASCPSRARSPRSPEPAAARPCGRASRRRTPTGPRAIRLRGRRGSPRGGPARRARRDPAALARSAAPPCGPGPADEPRQRCRATIAARARPARPPRRPTRAR